MSSGPDRQRSLQQYRLRADGYDAELAAFEPIRRCAIERLAPPSGACVLDLGCGTGLSFDLLTERVGPQGRIVGVEQSPDMLDKARQRIERRRWSHVLLLNAPVETARIPVVADAALFHFTHDILRHPEAIGNVLKHLKPGSPVVATGLQWSVPWDWLSNSFVWMAALYSVSSLEGLEQPWRLLAQALGPMEVTRMGGIYIASGKAP